MTRAYKFIVLLLIGLELATNPTNAFAIGSGTVERAETTPEPLLAA